MARAAAAAAGSARRAARSTATKRQPAISATRGRVTRSGVDQEHLADDAGGGARHQRGQRRAPTAVPIAGGDDDAQHAITARDTGCTHTMSDIPERALRQLAARGSNLVARSSVNCSCFVLSIALGSCHGSIIRSPQAPAGAGCPPRRRAICRTPPELGVAVDRERRRGRGAQSNATGRYEPLARDRLRRRLAEPRRPAAVQDHGDGRHRAQDHHPQRLARHLASTARSIPIAAASTAASTASRGRPTPISGLSPGLDFESKLFAKPDAPELLERELSAPGYEPRMIAIGTNTDPYQPIERALPDHARASSKCWSAPAIRSASSPSRRWCSATSTFCRAMAKRDLAKVALSVTTLDPKLARTHGAARGDAAAAAGDAAAAVRGRHADVGHGRAGHPGAQRRRDRAHPRCRGGSRRAEAGYVLLRLPLEVRDLFREWLMANYPDRYRARVHADPRHARRQGLRLHLGQAHEGHRARCLDDRPPLRDRLRKSSASTSREGDAHHRAFRLAAPAGAEQLSLF